MFSNYLFVVLLTALWLTAFVYPFKKKPRKNVKRLLTLVRTAFAWWVFGMAYRLLGFLVPNTILPDALDSILSYTVALPCRLGEGVETARVAALGGRFDLALAMVWGLPFAFISAGLVLAMQTALVKQHKSHRKSVHA